jgi:hypothetical protein
MCVPFDAERRLGCIWRTIVRRGFSLVIADWTDVPFMHYDQMPGSRGSSTASPGFCHVAVSIRPELVSQATMGV